MTSVPASSSVPHPEPAAAPLEVVLPERRAAHRVGARARARARMACADALGALLAWALASAASGALDPVVAATVVACVLAVLRAGGAHEREAMLLNRSSLDEVPSVVPPAVGAVAGAHLLLAALGVAWPASAALLTAALVAPAVPLSRAAVRASVRRRRGPERCLIVGGGEVAAMLARKMATHPEYGVELVGHLDEPWDRHERVGGLAWLGTVDQLDAVCEAQRVDHVLVAFSMLTHEHLLDVVRRARRLDIAVSVVPRLFETIGRGAVVDEVEGMTLLAVRSPERSWLALRAKRLLDVVVSAAALLVLSPVLAAIALAIRLDSPGPAFFVQERVGRRGRAFGIVKFRTMVDGADVLRAELAHLNEGGRLFKITDDPRATRLGRLLRRTSLDELPQLVNVLRGEMSLVGPRPLVPSEDASVLGRHRDRLAILPGMTGPWQALGRNEIPFEEMVRLDYLYAAEWSLWSDVRLIAHTVRSVLTRRAP